jgi:Zn-dependent protease with chaperone function
MDSADPAIAHALALAPFSPAEREGFFDNIARHRRAAMRVGWLAGACSLVLALVVAMLMAPLFYALIGLLLDVVNLVVPTPDLIGIVTKAVADLIDPPGPVPVWRYVQVALVAAIPGACMFFLVQRTLGRLMREAMAGDGSTYAARPPNASDLGEQRFSNTVAEMAIAAALPAPRVWITDNEAVNAAAFGADAQHANVVLSTGLLAGATRDELEGVAAHLVGCIANGDLRIGARIAAQLGMFGLVAQLSHSMADRRAAGRLLRLLRRSLRPGSSRADGELAMALTNPFTPQAAPPSDPAEDSGKIPWRTLAWMPLAGPLVFAGFFGGPVCAVVLGPILGVGWRSRKYQADATAVQLTRSPDMLGRALEKIRGEPVEGAFGAWIAHLCVVPSPLIGTRSILGGSSVPMAPPLDKRLKALGLMGAQVTPRAGRQMPLHIKLILAPVLLLVAVLMSAVILGLVYVSAALSGLFTWLPVVLLHALLR